jgi:hypothetical protein
VNFKKAAALGLLAGFVLTGTLGCLFAPVVPERTSNQGGGTILTATAKVLGGQMTELTADEVQIIADQINELDLQVDLTLDDDQAQAVVDFLSEYNIDSLDDFQTLDPVAVQPPEGATELLERVTLLDGGGG